MSQLIGIIGLVLLLGQVHLIRNVSAVVEHDEPAVEELLVVLTDSGPVEGVVKTILNNHQIYVFYGIPYAEPPVDELRFKPPQPVKPWTEALSTRKKPLPCYQKLKKASAFRTKYELEHVKRPWTENCLNLNIWVPKNKVENQPVMVVFHPGMFEYGSNNDPDGSVLAAKSQVIVVSMNYRLGPFGFLNLGNPDAPGNMGLLDQQLALKWIHQNIPHFGGSEKAVFLFGAGNAGSASVGYHLLSPGSADYFVSGFSLSGSPTCPWAYQERQESIQNSKFLSQRLGCSNKSVEEELDCLRHTHPEDIIDATTFYPDGSCRPILPTIDGTFITESPLDALKSGHFKKTLLMAANNVHEGSLVLRFLNQDLTYDPERGMSLEEFRKSVKEIFPTLSKAGMSAVEEFYLGNCESENNLKLRDAAVSVYTDFLVGCCMNQFDDLYVRQGGKVVRAVQDLRKASNPDWVGASHAITVQYTFGSPLLDDGYSPAEKAVANNFMQMLDMMTKGRASEVLRLVVPYDIEHKNYTFWDMHGPKFASRYREDQCKLWNEIIPRIHNVKKVCNKLSPKK